MQFAEVARTLFANAINWGRIVAFHGFAASYCIYATHCLHREVKRWFVDNPWEQFASYAEKVQLASSNNARQHPDPTDYANCSSGRTGMFVVESDN